MKLKDKVAIITLAFVVIGIVQIAVVDVVVFFLFK